MLAGLRGKHRVHDAALTWFFYHSSLPVNVSVWPTLHQDADEFLIFSPEPYAQRYNLGKKSFISVANIGCHGSRELYPTEIAFLSTRQECIGPVSFYIRANGA